MSSALATFFESPALIIGLVRSIVILLVSFGVQISEGQSAAIYGALGAVLAIISFILSIVTAKATVASPATPPAG